MPFDFGVPGLPDGEQINGAICGDKIGIERTITDPGRRAEVLAHEIAHALIHTSDLITERDPIKEAEADYLGGVLIDIVKLALKEVGRR